MSALLWSLWKDFEKKCFIKFGILGSQLKTPRSKREGNLWGEEENYLSLHSYSYWNKKPIKRGSTKRKISYHSLSKKILLFLLLRSSRTFFWQKEKESVNFYCRKRNFILNTFILSHYSWKHRKLVKCTISSKLRISVF